MTHVIYWTDNGRNALFSRERLLIDAVVFWTVFEDEQLLTLFELWYIRIQIVLS